MDAHRFDAIAKRFAGRRLSRRRALAQAGTGLAAGAFAAAGLAPHLTVRAQDATPAASPAALQNLEFLFVQVFESGTFRPKEGEPGVFVLSFNHSSAQTLYFSDRPARVVGTVPTARFLPDSVVDPPNAALVTRAADGAEDILVVELLQPTYDAAAGTLSYDVRVLENYEEDGLRYLADKQTDRTMPESFGQASLFIDECPAGEIQCFHQPSCDNVGSLGTVDHCGNDNCCGPCAHQDQAYWTDRCNKEIAACEGNCKANDNAWFGCFDGCGILGPG